jgi:hypothetical protein
MTPTGTRSLKINPIPVNELNKARMNQNWQTDITFSYIKNQNLTPDDCKFSVTLDCLDVSITDISAVTMTSNPTIFKFTIKWKPDFFVYTSNKCVLTVTDLDPKPLESPISDSLHFIIYPIGISDKVGNWVSTDAQPTKNFDSSSVVTSEGYQIE